MSAKHKMVVKLTNINKKKTIIETKYEYFNTLSKHFIESKNSFLLVFVLIWHFNGISSHFNLALAHLNSTEKMQRLYGGFERGWSNIEQRIIEKLTFMNWGLKGEKRIEPLTSEGGGRESRAKNIHTNLIYYVLMY